MSSMYVSTSSPTTSPHQQLYNHHQQLYHQQQTHDKDATSFSGKSSNLEKFKEYISFTATTWTLRWQEHTCLFRREQKLWRFQRKQSALHQVADRLVGGRKRCVIVWGKGSVNSSIIRGLPLAPNKTIYSYLARIGHTVILSSEYRSSQDSPCCVEQVWHPKRKARKLPFCCFCGCQEGCSRCPTHSCKSKCSKRHKEFSRISCCPKCKKMWNRDIAGARRIRDIFWETVTKQEVC